MRIKLAHDIDGPHCRLHEVFVKVANQELGLDIKFSDLTAYALEQSLLESHNIPIETTIALMEEVVNNQLRTAPPQNGAVKAFNKLNAVADQVMITSRCTIPDERFNFKGLKEHTYEWLNMHNYNIDHSKVNFRHDKFECMQELNITHIIEDHPGNAFFIAKNGFTVFLIDMPYNKENLHPKDKEKYKIRDNEWKKLHEDQKIIRVKGVSEVADIIFELNKAHEAANIQ